MRVTFGTLSDGNTEGHPQRSPVVLTVHQYRDRTEAGQVLARQLAPYASRVDTIVLGLGRGGVAVGAEVSNYLRAPLDVLLVRKLSLPDQSEVTLGAIASGGTSVLDDDVVSFNGITRADLHEITVRETRELKRSEDYYRECRPPPKIAGRVVIVVTDGLATGFAMHAAIIALMPQQPAWLVAAAPVGSPEACGELAQEAHQVVCPLRPEPLESVGLWYEHFSPIADEEVRTCLRRASALPSA
jgi:putative phosphoribosyl transferase